MTLSTYVYLTDPGIDPEWLHKWCNDNLIKPDREPAIERIHIGDKRWKFDEELAQEEHINNVIGQGFNSMLLIQHRNGELIDELADLGPKPDGLDEDDTWEWDHAEEVPKYYIRINFDTAYGYRDDRGYNATMLHASFIGKLVAMLHVKGVKVVWTDEFRGTYNDGMDLEAMKTFLGDGQEADQWFHSMVKPAIERKAAETGKTVQW